MTFGTFTYGSARPATIGDSMSLEARVALDIELSMRPFHEAISTALQDAADGLWELEKELGIKAPSVHLKALRERLSNARL